ncbi:hypothetical protein ABMA28_000374 [Loxostege sticticalis]|uniref:Paired domain-containing protein n=1 Tax=Loxostege sticticalis TaxID=481309 RepID=A0ABD0TS14_LOXSC
MEQEGRSQRSTARTVGVSLSTVQRVLQRFQETGMNIRRPGNGRPRCTTVREDRFIVSTMLRGGSTVAKPEQYSLVIFYCKQSKVRVEPIISLPV